MREEKSRWALSTSLRPNRLPERVVHISLEEMDIPVDRNFRAAMAKQFRDYLDRNTPSKQIGCEGVPRGADGKLDFGTWEQIFCGEFASMRDKRVLVKNNRRMSV